MRFESISTLASLTLVASLCGCGGDGNPPAPPGPAASAAGAYGGSSTGGTPTNFRLIVQQDGTFWHLYGHDGINGQSLAGFVQGKSDWTSTALTSANAIDFGAASTSATPFAFTYTSAHQVTGTANYGGQAKAFTGWPLDDSHYHYDTAAVVADAANDWDLTSLQGVHTPVHIAADGSLAGTDATGCSLSGQLAPSPEGKNYYTLTLTLGAAPCAHAGQVTTGIALRYNSMYGAHLLIATTSTARDFGIGLSSTP